MINKLRAQINRYFVGKEDVVEDVLVCLLAGGHVLLEDVPGVGKTTLARIVSESISAGFGRIQFTPDTLPLDVLGVSIYNRDSNSFEFHQGPIMNEIVLGDEINRTSPKTQAALLEAMAEGQISVDRDILPLPELFFVIATQNPSEYIGTYPLPEAQMDRFMMMLTVGYPCPEAEIRMAKNHLEGMLENNIESICSTGDIIEMRKKVREIHVSDNILVYIRDIIETTRKSRDFVTGASPRAMLSLLDASMAKAFLEGRDYVSPDDVKNVCVNVLHHRLSLTPEARIKSENKEKLIKNAVLSVKIPMDDK